MTRHRRGRGRDRQPRCDAAGRRRGTGCCCTHPLHVRRPKCSHAQVCNYEELHESCLSDCSVDSCAGDFSPDFDAVFSTFDPRSLDIAPQAICATLPHACGGGARAGLAGASAASGGRVGREQMKKSLLTDTDFLIA